ncbi:MAG: hypothetical protein AB1629_03250 [Candidatus Omnitrophota bacterium]
MNKILLIFISFLFFLTSCASVEGPISKKHFSSKENLEYLEEVLLYNRKKYVEHHKNLKPYIKKAILEGRIVKGMNKAEVKASWGEATNSYRSVTNNIVIEQWIYKDNIDLATLEKRDYYLNFREGILRSWQ